MFFHWLLRTSLFWEEENMRLALMQSSGAPFEDVAKREGYPADRSDPLTEFSRAVNMRCWYDVWVSDTTSTGPVQITTETSTSP